MANQRKLAQIIAAEPALAELRGRMAPISVLQQLCRQRLPPALKDCVRVGETVGQELRLYVDNGSAATFLRQHTPELVDFLRHKGHEFTGIRVGVQVRISPTGINKPVTKQIDKGGRQSLARLADSLDADAPLRHALERLLGKRA